MVSLKVKEVFCLFYALVLFFTGILMIGFSVIFAYKLFYHFKFVPSGSVGPFILLTFLGFIHLFLTWLAVKGPSRQHDMHIFLFMFITIVLLLAECATGVWNIILWDEVDVEAVLLMTESFKTVITEDFNKNSEWNKLQSKLKCCGLNGLGDYKTTKGSYPVSCCDEQTGSNITCYLDGCRLPLARYIKGILMNGAIMSFLLSIYQAFGIFLFYSFYQSLRRERKDRHERRSALQRELAEQSINSPQSPSVPSAPRMSLSINPETPKSLKSSKRRSSKGSAPSTPVVQTAA